MIKIFSWLQLVWLHLRRFSKIFSFFIFPFIFLAPICTTFSERITSGQKDAVDWRLLIQDLLGNIIYASYQRSKLDFENWKLGKKNHTRFGYICFSMCTCKRIGMLFTMHVAALSSSLPIAIPKYESLSIPKRPVRTSSLLY